MNLNGTINRTINWVRTHPVETILVGMGLGVVGAGVIVSTKKKETPEFKLAIFEDQWNNIHPENGQDLIFEYPEATVVIRRFLVNSDEV